MFTVTLLVILVGVYVFYKIKLRKFEVFAKKLPGDVRLTPLGDLLPFLFSRSKKPADLFNILMNMTRKHRSQGLMKFWAGPQLMVLVWKPEYILEISNHHHCNRKGKLLQYLLGENVAPGIFLNEGDQEWKELRKKLNDTMKNKYLIGRHQEVFCKKAKELVEHLIKDTKNDEELNIADVLEKEAFETFSETHLGIETSYSQKWSPVALSYARRYVMERIKMGFEVWPIFLSIFKRPAVTNILELAGDIAASMIQYRKEIISQYERKEGDYEYYLDFLMRRGAEKGLSEDRICKEIVDVALAGADTSSAVLASLLVFLAMYPNIQEQVYSEQLAMFGDDLTRDPSPQDLANMELLNRVIKETMRLASPPFINKQTTADIKLGNYEIPKGAFLVILTQLCHRLPEYWERPDGFFPDHFLPGRAQARPDFAYIPFGVGIRRCPGEKYGKNVVATTASYLVRNFKFSTKWKLGDIKYQVGILNRFQEELYNIRIEKRHH